ncbi:unnamed protein product [Rotaria sp. Silwood2]|nr:unnamed protein product [Rotaria sp. Silwood2]
MTPNKSSKRSSIVVTSATANDQQIRKKKKTLKSNDIVLKSTNKKKKRIKKILPDETSFSKDQTSQNTPTSINPINIEQQQNSSTDNLALLLTQGLQNNDSNVLDSTLGCQLF